MLDADPGLLDGMDSQSVHIARRSVIAQLVSVRTGSWTPEKQLVEDDKRAFGYLVIDGLICRRATVEDTTSVELLGAGDVLHPFDYAAPQSSSEVRWSVLRHAELAHLDEDFSRSAARWPSVMIALLARVSERADALATQLAISHVTGVEKRVLLAFHHLANRWGRVTPHGILIPLRLTTEMIGQVIGARRPSVSAALADLDRRGVVERCSDGAWLLHDAPELVCRGDVLNAAVAGV